MGGGPGRSATWAHREADRYGEGRDARRDQERTGRTPVRSG
ncbi:hypothetical protein [Streptomyces rubiginosohelvolus]